MVMDITAVSRRDTVKAFDDLSDASGYDEKGHL